MGAGIKRKKKRIALGLALAFMLASACFKEISCFTCTYAYVRACVASKNKLVFFMLVRMPGLRL